MRRSQYRRESPWSKWFSGRRRIVAAAATLVAFGGIVTVTQISNASTNRSTQRAMSACNNIQAPRAAKLSTETRRGTYTTNKGRVTQHADDGAGDVPTVETMRARCRQWVMQNASNQQNNQQNNQQQGQNGQQQGGNNNQQQGQNGQQQGGKNNQQQGQNGQQQGGNNNQQQGQNGQQQGGKNNQQQGQNGQQQGGKNNQQQGQNGQQQGGNNNQQQGQNGQQQNGNNNNQQQNGNNNGQQQGGNNNQQQGNNGGNNNGGNNNNQTPPPGAGLGVLTNSCKTSQLPPHDGFQKGDRCVSTEFGEVGSAANNPSLLIVDAPQQVAAGQPFSLKVSTRNLIRDRFLAAGQGGYYVESSVLQGGIVRGHFHTACRMLDNTNAAPQPDPVPAFFVATEDKQGGRGADVVTINVPGLPQQGTAQCASWAGDGSHRIPMMERANQTPAFDAVRIQVAGGGNNGGNNNGGNNGQQQNNNGQQQNNNGQQQNGQQQNNNNGGQQQNGQQQQRRRN
ncbi:Pecanex-like protein 1 [Krasilnikovia sp. MM14-A1259]|uniref:Pecanex-like protein 1 n=1 Tax=Krasilnikovia sp. MM14-A1259 TaxID=3373539 RepID=UPI003801A1FF